MTARVFPAEPTFESPAEQSFVQALRDQLPDDVGLPDVVAAGRRAPPHAGGNRALVDGHQRLGWLGTVVFLDPNAHEPELSDDAAFQLVMDVAAGSAEVEEIAERLRTRRADPLRMPSMTSGSPGAVHVRRRRPQRLSSVVRLVDLFGGLP
ncbi:hypothetical protein O2W15_20625 [Modestobacter sp. VKM Ac-2979]|uniref:hypothetical protein n=1 Tax=unclassified Modestobacter TaxID=2643866 RepID=UPI0022ABB251|nr:MULTISPECIES: hypothetical protein [unclassified Modestobacter]MCZ2813844.1 hypothetical protein [Modestobacter sp. VKM Ac-2979]MCZ2844181.1 hypothetical protein [Modestobacter sp. VKM Ac-2980]